MLLQVQRPLIEPTALMDRMAKRIGDKQVLQLPCRFLAAGSMADGGVGQRIEGRPQRGPLSPLQASVLLDDVDQAWSPPGPAWGTGGGCARAASVPYNQATLAASPSAACTSPRPVAPN